MKIKFKNIILFAFILLLWSLGGLIFRYNDNFYSLLNLPVFTLPKTFISYIWILLYISITTSIYIVIKTTNIFKNTDYLYVLITNYLANQLFSFTFWKLMSPFLAFVMTSITFISSIFLYLETKSINKKASYFIIPYIIFGAYTLILSLSVFLMNF